MTCLFDFEKEEMMTIIKSGNAVGRRDNLEEQEEGLLQQWSDKRKLTPAKSLCLGMTVPFWEVTVSAHLSPFP